MLMKDLRLWELIQALSELQTSKPFADSEPCADLTISLTQHRISLESYAAGFDFYLEKGGETNAIVCSADATGEEADAFFVKAFKEIEALKELKARGCAKTEKVEMVRREYEQKMKEMSDEYMAKLQRYEGNKTC